MDKRDYLNKLKTLDLRPEKIKIKESKPVILNEVPHDNEKENILELFVQTAEIESMPPGPERDIQILRISMIAELDASNLYEKLATLASDERVGKVLLDISREEKVHAGEFESLIVEIDPEYEKAKEEGEEEVDALA